jgi:hypothetical protein
MDVDVQGTMMQNGPAAEVLAWRAGTKLINRIEQLTARMSGRKAGNKGWAKREMTTERSGK